MDLVTPNGHSSPVVVDPFDSKTDALSYFFLALTLVILDVFTCKYLCLYVCVTIVLSLCPFVSQSVSSFLCLSVFVSLCHLFPPPHALNILIVEIFFYTRILSRETVLHPM